MLNDMEKKEIVGVIKNANAVAENLAKRGNLVEAGCVHSVIQAVRYLYDRLNVNHVPTAEVGNEVGNEPKGA